LSPAVSFNERLRSPRAKGEHEPARPPGCSRFITLGKLGRPKIDKATEAAIRAALEAGDAGMHKIAAAFGVGTGTVQRIKAEIAG
jgi:hypothetical protein